MSSYLRHLLRRGLAGTAFMPLRPSDQGSPRRRGRTRLRPGVPCAAGPDGTCRGDRLGLETMPPKSTYFYPKLLTGLVLNPLR